MSWTVRVYNTALRNGKNITLSIHFGNGFITIAKDNIKNKNHEIISSLFLRSFGTAKDSRRSDEKIDVIKFGTFREDLFHQLHNFLGHVLLFILKEVF